MAQEHRNYAPLREAHQQALEALNKHIEQNQQPAQERETGGRSVQVAQIEQAERQAAAEVTGRQAPERPEGHVARIQQEERAAAFEVTGRSAPERPEGRPADRPAWTGRGDMASHNRSAVDWVRASHEARAQHTAKLDELNKHIESRGQTPEQKPDVGRAPDKDRER